MIGKTIGPYTVLAKLGEGGMGEVYRARDSKLKRDVAIKILPADVANDPERLARFQREAEVLASLNHPHIAHVYGIEEGALVMELVEGEDLSQRVARGPIPIDEALPIARQIAEALEAAHDAGIIHRDLKPANVKVRPDGTVKVLDFGLAKAFDMPGSGIRDPGSGRDPANSPTITSPAMTAHGMILGTAAYMSPEQAKGKFVDRRTDIWAFGCVLYEMLTGYRTFQADSASETMAKILERDPDWSRLPVDVPPNVARLLRRCLNKDPRLRIHHAADARLELADTGREESNAASRKSRRFSLTPAWAIVLLAVGGAIGLLVAPGLRVTAPAATVRVQIDTPPGVRLAVDSDHPVIALAPDGSALVFVGDENGVRHLFLRRLSEDTAQRLAGTQSATSPFFSPDSRWIAFYSKVGLSKVAVDGGVPVDVLVTTNGQVARGGTWSADDFAVFAPSTNGGLLKASMAVDRLQPIATAVPLVKDTRAAAWPANLHDGRYVLFADFTEVVPLSRLRQSPMDRREP